jgi:hypothetical protein
MDGLEILIAVLLAVVVVMMIGLAIVCCLCGRREVVERSQLKYPDAWP